LVFLIDNARIAMGGRSCESNCFYNQPQPDLNEGLGRLD
jgi:hypothetical protein